jgi:hypothetical protein
MADLNIDRLSGDMDAQLQELEDLDAKKTENKENDSTFDRVVDVDLSHDDETPQNEQTEPSAKDFLTMLFSQSPFDSVRSRDGRSYQAAHDTTETGRTKYFYCLELVVSLLYWYNAFHAILTEKMQLICPCYLTDGMILVALWRTRCNSPVTHAILFATKTGLCFLCKTASSKFVVDSNKVVDDTLFEMIFRLGVIIFN